jgi:hypothetical protein
LKLPRIKLPSFPQPAEASAAATMPLRAAYRRPIAGRWTITLLWVALVVASLAYGYLFAATAPYLLTPMMVPPALMMILIIWALPAGEYAPTGWLQPLFLGFLAAMILWPNYLAIALPGLPWVTMTRLFGVPLTIVLLICISVSKTFRSRLMACLNVDPIIWWALIGLVITQTITLALTDNISISVSRYILAQTNWTAMFVASCYIFLRKGAADIWAKSLFAMALTISLVGMWEAKLGYVPWAGHIPSFLKIEDDAVIRALSGATRTATGLYRVQSTATTPLGLAEVLGLTAPFALHFALGPYKLYFRILALATLPLLLFTILLTDSRLGVVSCLVSLVLYLLFWALLRWRQVKDSMFAPAIVFAYPALFTGLVAATFVITKLRNKVWGGGAQQASTESRKIQWEMGIPKILSHPLGYGMGRSGHALQFKNPAGVTTVDSYYLSLLLEIGIAGFVIYFFMFLRAAWTGSRSLLQAPSPSQEVKLLIPFSVCLVNYVIIKSVFSQDANHPLAFMMLGAVMALVYRARTETPQPAATSAPASPRGKSVKRR